MVYNSDSKVVACLRILEGFVKTVIAELSSQSFLFRSEVRHKNSHFQQIPGDAVEAVLWSTLRTTSLYHSFLIFNFISCFYSLCPVLHCLLLDLQSSHYLSCLFLYVLSLSPYNLTNLTHVASFIFSWVSFGALSSIIIK